MKVIWSKFELKPSTSISSLLPERVGPAEINYHEPLVFARLISRARLQPAAHSLRNVLVGNRDGGVFKIVIARSSSCSLVRLEKLDELGGCPRWILVVNGK